MELGTWDLRLKVRNQTFETAFLKQLSYPGFTYLSPKDVPLYLDGGLGALSTQPHIATTV